MSGQGHLEFVPGEAIGPFRIGSTLFNTLNLLRTFKTSYPAVKVAWDDISPATSPIQLILSTPPLTILFDAQSQRILRLELHSPDHSVTYRGKALRSSEDDDQDVVKVVRRVMGPTYSAKKEGAEEMLSYPGVAFGVVKGESVGAASRLSRIVVTSLSASKDVPIDEAWLHPTLPTSPAIARGDLRMAEVLLDASLKPASVLLHFHSIAEGTPAPMISLRLHVTTSEDLLCDLGSPVRSFWKEDDRMSIHASPTEAIALSTEPNPYFLSHPHLGLTFLIHPTSHTLLKIILHSNLPSQVNFGRSVRCAFNLVAPPSPTSVESIVVSGGERFDEIVAVLFEGRSEDAIEEDNKFNEVRRERERPMILDRAVDTGDAQILGKTTEIHGFPGIAFEVTSSHNVETVWLF